MDSSSDYKDVVPSVDLSRFMGTWYVLAGRFTLFEKDAYNGNETYTWNATEQRIDIDFKYRKGAFDGPVSSIPQKGWVVEGSQNAHWKVSPLWPLKFDYLILAMADDYSWTAVGVSSQKYLWIMARDWRNPQPIIDAAIVKLREKKYNVENLVLAPQKW